MALRWRSGWLRRRSGDTWAAPFFSGSNWRIFSFRIQGEAWRSNVAGCRFPQIFVYFFLADRGEVRFHALIAVKLNDGSTSINKWALLAQAFKEVHIKFARNMTNTEKCPKHVWKGDSFAGWSLLRCVVIVWNMKTWIEIQLTYRSQSISHGKWCTLEAWLALAISCAVMSEVLSVSFNHGIWPVSQRNSVSTWRPKGLSESFFL